MGKENFQPSALLPPALGFGVGAASCAVLFFADFSKELSAFCEQVWGLFLAWFLGLLTLVSDDSVREPRDSLAELGRVPLDRGFPQHSCVLVLKASCGANALV